MPIVGFNFKKISAEKKAQVQNNDKIQNIIKIATVEESTIKIGSEEQKVAAISFEFAVDYAEAGKLEFLGNIIYYDTEEVVKGLISGWKNESKVNPQFGTMIYNFIMARCNIKALQFEDEVGLPLHLRLPRLRVSPEDK